MVPARRSRDAGNGRMCGLETLRCLIDRAEVSFQSARKSAGLPPILRRDDRARRVGRW